MTKQQIEKYFMDILGMMPTSKQISSLGLTSLADGEKIIKDTKSETQSNPVTVAKNALTSLGAPGSYENQMAQSRQQINEMYNLPQIEENLTKYSKFAGDMEANAPMFSQTAKQYMGQQVSPKFLGATRKDMEDYFKGIGDPIVRDKMVGSYLDAADQSMTSVLEGLNSLYKTSVDRAKNKEDAEAGHYDRMAKLSQELYSEAQFAARERLDEKRKEESEARDQATWEARQTKEKLKTLEEPLSIIDVQRYKDLYPDAGVTTEDTRITADAKIKKMNQPREYTDDEIKAIVSDYKSKKEPYETVISDLDADPKLLNKDKTKIIAAQIYGKGQYSAMNNFISNLQKFLFR